MRIRKSTSYLNDFQTIPENVDPLQIFRMPKRMTLPEKQKNSDETIEKNLRFWKETLENQRITKVLAPMVDQRCDST